MSTGKVVLGALAGLAIGAVAGILYAPDKGSTTRKQLLNKGREYTDGLKSKYGGKFDEAKKEVMNAASEVNNATASNYGSSIKRDY